uniref:Uncharacterized protein n=1 Tax=Anguilla anguilla TaxID=7936 RepID=A0A0E9R9W0_ANGAN
MHPYLDFFLLVTSISCVSSLFSRMVYTGIMYIISKMYFMSLSVVVLH